MLVCGGCTTFGAIVSPLDSLPSPPLRGRGVGGEGAVLYPLTPDPSPPKRGRGEKKNPLTPDPSPPKRGRGERIQQRPYNSPSMSSTL